MYLKNNTNFNQQFRAAGNSFTVKPGATISMTDEEVKDHTTQFLLARGILVMLHDDEGLSNVVAQVEEAQAKVEESKNFLVAAGAGKLEGVPAIDYEFRTTTVAQLHDAGSFAGIGPWIEGAKRYFLQVFTDRDTVPFAGLSAPSEAQMRAYADLVRPYAADVQIRGLN